MTPLVKPVQVEITAKSEAENAHRDAAAKTVISNAELARYGDSNITDAMKRVPGIIVVNGAIQLPGMSSNYTQILIDGELQQGVNITNIPMNMIESVEIYRLGTAQFSSQAMAGTINIVLKKIPNTAQQQIKLGLVSQYQTTADFEWLGSDKRGEFSYSLSISGRDHPDFSASPHYTRSTRYSPEQGVIQDFQQRSYREGQGSDLQIDPVVQYKNADGLSIRVNSLFYFQRGSNVSITRYDFLVGKPLSIAQSNSNEQSEAKNGNANIKITDTIWNTVKFDLKLGIGGGNRTHRSTGNNYTPDYLHAFKQTIFHHEYNKGINSTLKLTAPNSDEHDLVAGWTIGSDTSNAQRLQLDEFTSPKSAEQVEQNTHVQVNHLAFFVQDEWKFRKASSAYLGLRWETVNTGSTGHEQVESRTSSRVWSPIAQALWQLNPENTDRLRLGLSRTYKAPANLFLTLPKYTLVNSGIDNPNWRGNPALKPELAWSLEGAYEHNGSDEWNYNLRLAVKKIEDVHRQRLSEIDGLWWSQYVNAGQAISKRIDFDTQFPLKRFMSDAPDINFSFFISKNWSSISHLPKPDNLLTPRTLSINSSVDYTAKNFPLTLGGSLRYLDGHPVQINLNKRQINAVFTDLDVYAVWKFTAKNQLRLAIDNLLKPERSNTLQLFETVSTTIFSNPQRSYRSLKLNYEQSF